MANLDIVTARLPTGQIVRVVIPEGKDSVLIKGKDGKLHVVRKAPTQSSEPPRTPKHKPVWKMPEPPRGSQAQPPSHTPERLAKDMTLPNPLVEQRKRNIEIARTNRKKGGKAVLRTPNQQKSSEAKPRPTATVSQFAYQLKIPVAGLLEQLKKAGVDKQGEHDSLTEQDKERLFDYLRRAHADKSKTKTILTRKTAPKIKETVQQESDPHVQAEVIKVDVPPSHKQPTIVSAIDYQWPSKFEHGPYQHQIRTTEFLVQHQRAFCLNDMGSGKTASVLWAFDYLRQQGQVKKMLVVSPLSTLQRTWGDEISGSFKHLRYSVLTGTGEQRRKLLRENADIYIINHDGLKVAGMVEAINRRQDIDIVVIDEIAQAARSAATDRWRAFAKVVRHELAQGGKRRVFGLTGTPTPNSPIDAWAQCRLIVPERVPPYFNTFKDATMQQVGYQRWEAKPEAVQLVAEAMQPSIRFKRDECIDLPPVTYQTREVALTAEQSRLYREMLVRLRAELDSGEITAVNELVKVNKLLQIATGAAYKTDGDTAYITPKERLEVVEEIIEEASGSIIVFVPFRGALDAVASYLTRKGLSVDVIHGGVSQKNRDQIFQSFQKELSIRVLVAQPASMAHGLNLTAANTIIWFGPIYSNEIYQQGCARITRPGQVRNQLIVHIQGCPAERRVYERLREKENVQGLLLELLRENRDD